MIAIFVWTVSGVIDATIICGILLGFILIGIGKLVIWAIDKWENRK